MSSKGRGSAAPAAVALLSLLCLLACTETIEAATYTVGDSSGWTFNVASWPKGKRFKAGDILVFNYSPGAHNVVAVSGRDYKNCNAATGSKVLQSGKDRVVLKKGSNFFICSVSGHCAGGMKIAVNAA